MDQKPPRSIFAHVARAIDAVQHRIAAVGGQCLGNRDQYRLGKLRLPQPPSEYVPSRLRETQTLPLPISLQHALRGAELPLHHRDPFDRAIIAQAQLEKLSVMTADPLFALYDVDIIAP